MSQTKAQLIDPTDGSIVNADINASAAIAGTKVSPDFGSQNIVTTGTINSNDITIQDSQPRLNFNDNSGSPHDPDYLLQVDSGIFRIFDSSNNANRLLINTDGHIDIDGNVDFGAGIDVTGAITGTGDLTLSSGGKVLIGTTTEGSTLGDDLTIAQASGAAGITIRTANDTVGSLLFSDATSGTGEYAGFVQYSHSSDEMVIGANSSETVKIHDEHFNIVAPEGTLRMNFGFQDGLGGELSLYDDAGNQKTRICGSANANNFFNNGGNVGIGLTNPTKVLHVAGTSSPEILLQPSDASPGLFIADSNRTGDGQHLAEFGARWNGTKVARIVMQAGDDTTNKDNGQLVFFTSATGTVAERLRINEGGDVGINESAPSARLHVNGGSGLLVERSSGTSIAGFKHSGASAMNIYFQNTGSTNHPSIGSSNQDLTIATNNTERLRVLSGGGLTFNGDTAAANALHDYEEGTWTPVDASGGGISISASSNRYTKIGRMVFAAVRCQFGSSSNGSTAKITLPFVPDSNIVSSAVGSACFEQNYDSNNTVMACINDTAGVIFRKNGSGNLKNNQVSNTILRFCVYYMTGD